MSDRSYKDNWVFSGGGGYDTARFCRKTKAGDAETIMVPGLKQIWHHGKLNYQWWMRYLFYLVCIKKQ